MDNKNLGYGIAGKKNFYSSRSLLDNWVEDGFGGSALQLGSQRVLDGHYVSVARASHIDPRLMTYHPNILTAKTEKPEDVMQRNKDGYYSHYFML